MRMKHYRGIIAVIAIIAATFVSIGCKESSSSSFFPMGGGSKACWASWITDGGVYGVTTSGNSIYFVGDFTSVWANSGSGAAVNSDTGKIPARSYVLYIDGSVTAVASDGKGGWYIGGDFGQVGNFNRDQLAHINSNGTVDANWSFTVNGSAIKAIVVSGSNIYVGGTFTQITDAVNTYARVNLARLKSDGTVDAAWFPNASGTASTVNALALSGGSLYVGGIFTTIGGISQNHLAAVNTSNNSAQTWSPGLASGATNVIYDIAVSGDTVYVAGGFNGTIGGQSRKYVAGLSASSATANATGFNPNPNLPVYTLAVSKDGNTVYAGGLFFSGGVLVSIGGGNLDFLAALNASNGTAILTWTPNPDGLVNDIVVSGDTVYVGGSFSTISGDSRDYAAALSTNTAAVRDWNPVPDGTVNTLAVSGGKVYVGGSFMGINVTTRNMAAAVDGGTGLLTSWDPNVTGNIVNAVAADGGMVYLGGDFTQVGTTPCNFLAGVSAKDGTVSTFSSAPDGEVYALKAYGGNLYVGGNFTSYLNAYDLDTNASLAGWTSPVLNDVVNALEASGGNLYAGGAFDTVDGDGTYQYLVCLATDTGAITQIKGFDFDPMSALASGEVDALLLSNKILYTGGLFNGTVGGFAKQNLADIYTGNTSGTPGSTISGWNPAPSSTVYALSALKKTLYAAGAFTSADGVTTSVAAINVEDGVVSTTWTPTANDTIDALKAFTNVVLVGGNFTFVTSGSLYFPSLVAIDRETGLPYGY